MVVALPLQYNSKPKPAKKAATTKQASKAKAKKATTTKAKRKSTQKTKRQVRKPNRRQQNAVNRIKKAQKATGLVFPKAAVQTFIRSEAQDHKNDLRFSKAAMESLQSYGEATLSKLIKASFMIRVCGKTATSSVPRVNGRHVRCAYEIITGNSATQTISRRGRLSGINFSKYRKRKLSPDSKKELQAERAYNKKMGYKSRKKDWHDRISSAAIKRLAARQGVPSLAFDTYGMFKAYFEYVMKEPIRQAVIMVGHARRRTVSKEDVDYALGSNKVVV